MFNPNICIMTKTRRWPSLLLAAFTVLSFGACEDWGQMDPPAGTDVYPKLEQVYSETFGGNFDPTTSMTLFAYDEGDVPTVVVDEERDSVLHLANGYARLFNPLTNYKAQDGVSLTFWVKQALFLDEETEEPLEEDLDGALFSFQNFNGTQRMFMTANGYLKYEGVDGEWESTDLLETKTGMLNNAGEWHYVAVTVKDNGYSVYVDGEQRIDKLVPASEFPFSKVVQFMAGCDHIYLGYGSDVNTKEMWIDDLTIYRNQITKKEQARPGSGVEEEVDYRNFMIVGSEDCTDGFFAQRSPFFPLEDGQTLNIEFINYTAGGNNWENWVLVLTNGVEFGGAGYAEHFVLRADAFGWGDGNYDGGKITSDFNWDTFKTIMNGSLNKLKIKRSGNTVTMEAKITSEDGATTHNYSFEYTGDLGATGIFLTGEKNYIKIDVERTVYGETYEAGENIFGNQDCTSGWWSAHSPLQVISGDTTMPFVHVLTNNGSGGANWNNWVLVITNGKAIGEDGVAELMVLRSDAYGWGTYYNGENLTHTFNWDTFIADMQGAYCRIAVERKGGEVTITAKVRTAAGVLLGDYVAVMKNVPDPEIGLQFTVDSSWYEFHSIGYMPFWDYITQ